MNRFRRNRSIGLLLWAWVAGLAVSPGLHAQLTTWTGGGGSQANSWSLSSNWNGGVPGTGASVTFQGAYNSNAVNYQVQISSLTYAAGSGGTISILGGDLSLTSNGMVSSSTNSNSVIVDNAVTTQNSLTFYNSATINSAHVILEANGGNNASGGATPEYGGEIIFHNSSDAGTANIQNYGAYIASATAGLTYFYDSATADGASVVNVGATSTGLGGQTSFNNTSTAGQATVYDDASSNGGGSGSTTFHTSASGGTAYLINYGGTSSGATGGLVTFYDSSTAGGAFLSAPGGTGGGSGASIHFYNTSSAGTGVLESGAGSPASANGAIYFQDSASGATALVEDYGTLDVSSETATGGASIGAIIGSGIIYLGSKTLTIGGTTSDSDITGSIKDGGTAGGTGAAWSRLARAR